MKWVFIIPIGVILVAISGAMSIAQFAVVPERPIADFKWIDKGVYPDAKHFKSQMGMEAANGWHVAYDDGHSLLFVKEYRRWEYKRIPMDAPEHYEQDDKRHWESVLNKQGRDGWELVDITIESGIKVYVFKRQY